MSETLKLTEALIERRSVTPDDAGCQELIAGRLSSVGFAVEAMAFGAVSNIWATHGNEGPLLCFAGHTDVVPAGPVSDWDADPFVPSQRDGLLFGRGAADMKGSLAAMITAAESFVREHPEHSGTLAFLITSDEEGDAVDGTTRVVETLSQRGVRIDSCLVGEPSSAEQLGDTIRIGRRGSLNLRLTVFGVQGHVAYPDIAVNPIHRLAPVLNELTAMTWDDSHESFPPTSFQVSNIHAGTDAANVIPATVQVTANFRFSPTTTADELRNRVTAILKEHDVAHQIDWQLSGDPFLSEPGSLTSAVEDSVFEELGYRPVRSTGGGTSDGRFIAPTGAEIVELGPVNASIHQVNEHVALDDLERLHRIYKDVIARLLGQAPRRQLT